MGLECLTYLLNEGVEPASPSPSFLPLAFRIHNMSVRRLLFPRLRDLFGKKIDGLVKSLFGLTSQNN
jgi:hypothetical protein